MKVKWGRGMDSCDLSSHSFSSACPGPPAPNSIPCRQVHAPLGNTRRSPWPCVCTGQHRGWCRVGSIRSYTAYCLSRSHRHPAGTTILSAQSLPPCRSPEFTTPTPLPRHPTPATAITSTSLDEVRVKRHPWVWGHCALLMSGGRRWQRSLLGWECRPPGPPGCSLVTLAAPGTLLPCTGAPKAGSLTFPSFLPFFL